MLLLIQSVTFLNKCLTLVNVSLNQFMTLFIVPFQQMSGMVCLMSLLSQCLIPLNVNFKPVPDTVECSF